MRQRVILLLLLLLGATTFIFAKEYHFAGKVIDEQTSKPIPFVTILVKNTVYGTQANEQGEFQLHLPHGYEKDTLTVRMLSYTPQLFAVANFADHPVISLAPKEELLNEVVVYATNPEDVLQKAAENWEQNHKIETSQVQRSFYRELFFESGQCFRVGEGLVDDYELHHTKDSVTTSNKILLARGIQDSLKLRWINDVFRLRHDTISLDFLMSAGISGVDLVNFLNTDTTAQKKENVENTKARKKKKGRGVAVNIKFDKELKYGGLVKHNNRMTHRIIVALTADEEPIFKGQILIDSATYAYAGIQLSNQRVDLYKKFMPWYAKLAIRILGYKLKVKDINYSCMYHVLPNEKWTKSYAYMRYGGSITKRRQTLDGYVQNEFFYEIPKSVNPADSISVDKNFKETIVTSFDDSFWTDYKVPLTPTKVKQYVVDIDTNNKSFEGSIGFNKRESRKRRRIARRLNRNR